MSDDTRQQELHEKVGDKIASLSMGDANNLFLMMQDLMYFDSMPDVYKDIIHTIFESEKSEETAE